MLIRGKHIETRGHNCLRVKEVKYYLAILAPFSTILQKVNTIASQVVNAKASYFIISLCCVKICKR